MTKPQVVRALQIARVLDESGNLSISTIVLCIVVWRMTQQSSVSLTDLGTFLGSIVGYQVRRAIAGAAPNTAEDSAAVKQALAEMETKVTALQLGQQLRR